MTIFICQCPHLAPAKVWTAESESEIIDAIVGSADLWFGTAIEAASYDMRDAYCTDDPLDLWLWINGKEAPRATNAREAFMRDGFIRSEVESVADLDEDQDDLVYTAFCGEFVWSENEMAWQIGNQSATKADDLFDALCAASLVLAARDNMVVRDA